MFAVAVLALWLLPVYSSASVDSSNIYNVLQTFSDYGLLALAVGLSMIVAEYDLSTASMYSLAGMVAVLLGVGVSGRRRTGCARGRPDVGRDSGVIISSCA